jgi:hypothetical protein
VPVSWFLSSLQDEFGSRSVTGGATVGDHRLLSAILSGLIAGISIGYARAHDFAVNRKVLGCFEGREGVWLAYFAGLAEVFQSEHSVLDACSRRSFDEVEKLSSKQIALLQILPNSKAYGLIYGDCDHSA